MKYFKPKCVLSHRTGIYYNNRGYLTPCCFADGPEEEEDWKEFYDESLNVCNNDSIEDIITSDVCTDFFYNIINNIKLKKVCEKYCMEDSPDGLIQDPHIRRVDADYKDK